MSRHIALKRIPSGILFSRPVNLATAPTDVWLDEMGVKKDGIDLKTRVDRHESNATAMSDHASGFGPSSFALYPKTLNEPRTIERNFANIESTQEQTTIYCLPVFSIAIEVTVDGTLACSELTQTFRNPLDTEISEAQHTFPLYGGSTVTSFECIIGDERRLREVVKPKEEARQLYREAVDKKKETAALLTESTPEIFETLLGNISPRTDVQVKLTYLHELKVVQMTEHKGEGVAVIVPTSIAPRYGEKPPSVALKTSQLKIEIRVVDNGMINYEGCHIESGHEIEYQGRQPMKRTFAMSDVENLKLEQNALPALGQLIWKHESHGAVLRKDFILVLQMRSEYQTQSRALISPPNSDGHAAMMVNIRPSDLFSFS